MGNEKAYCPQCGDEMILAGKAGSGRQRYKCKSCSHRTTTPLREEERNQYGDLDSGKITKRISELRKIKKENPVSRYVITSAQNNTPINKPFFRSLLTYCKENNATLIVIPVRYKNPTSMIQWTKTDMWWPSEVHPFLLDRKLSLNKNLCVMGDIKIVATAVDPVSGLETISGTKSAIFGHAQMRMKMIATPQDRLPKMLHTTGSLSLKNYSSTKAGAKGTHHHITAALVAECSNNAFFVRELLAEPGGAFYDLDKRYDGENIEYNRRIKALVTGDEHIVHSSADVCAATYENKDSIVAVLRPEIIVRHDVLDFYSQNHHHKNNLLRKYAKRINNIDDIRHELKETISYIDRTTPEDCINYIVPSNHNDALTRWLNEYNPFGDLINLRFYSELMLKMCDEIEKTGDIPDAFQLYGEKMFKSKTMFLDRRKSCLIAGIDVAQHGDAGVNGARGSINSYAATEYKSIIGHSHTPGIRFGCYQVGTSSILNLEYNKGLSSWMNTHAIIYPNGKRSLVNVVEGRWRL